MGHAPAYGQSLPKQLKHYNQDWWLLKMSEDYFPQEPIAVWNTEKKYWMRQETDLFSTQWLPYVATWLTSGTMRNGKLFKRQMPALRTGAQESSLLPTPNTMEHREIKTPEQIAELKKRSPGGYRNLRETVVNELGLLPTPLARDYKETNKPHTRGDKVQVDNVPRAVFQSGEVSADGTTWGKYEPAIRRWEAVLGRKSPAPTRPDGKDGNHRLSPEFTEFLMGLPEGWITGHGLGRIKELKLAGNGVVPQQAELALRNLLQGTEMEGYIKNGIE